jgi:hypothetical protein
VCLVGLSTIVNNYRTMHSTYNIKDNLMWNIGQTGSCVSIMSWHTMSETFRRNLYVNSFIQNNFSNLNIVTLEGTQQGFHMKVVINFVSLWVQISYLQNTIDNYGRDCYCIPWSLATTKHKLTGQDKRHIQLYTELFSLHIQDVKNLEAITSSVREPQQDLWRVCCY